VGPQAEKVEKEGGGGLEGTSYGVSKRVLAGRCHFYYSIVKKRGYGTQWVMGGVCEGVDHSG